MGNDIEVTLKLKDELTKGMKKVNRASSEFTQQMIEAGKSTEGFSDDVIGAEEELTKLFVAEEKAAKEGISLAEAMDTSGEAAKKLAENVNAAEKAQKASDKQAKKVSKGLGGMAKGLIGVATAYAGGRAIIGFAKDSFAAADAAGKLPPIFADLSDAIKDLKVLVGVGLGTILAPVAEGAEDLITSHTDVLKGVEDIDKAYEEGRITLDQQAKLFDSFADSSNTEADLRREILITEKQRTKELEKQRIVTQRGRGGRGQLSDELLQRRRRGGKIEMDPIPAEIVPFFKDLDLGIGDQIRTAIAQLDFEAIGGRELVQTFNQAFEALNGEAVGKQFADDMFDQLTIQEQQFQVELGNITAEEAARNISETLGVSMEEARAMVKDIEATLKAIAGMKIAVTIAVKIQEVGGGGVSIGTSGATGGANFGEGGIPGGVPGSGTNTGVDIGGATGISGKVPSGFPNDSFLIGATSGEEFNVRTPGQQASMGGSTANLEASINRLSGDIKNMTQDFLQGVAEIAG